jgi:hypothetical protein
MSDARKRLARLIAKALHQHGDVLDDGRLAVDPDAVADALAGLGLLRARERDDGQRDQGRDHGEDGEGEDSGEDFDPVAEGRAIAERQRRTGQRAKDAFR